MRFSIFATSLIAALAIPVQPTASGQDRWNSGFIVFDAPNSGAPVCAPFGCGTYGYATNSWGTIVGYYIDPNNISHGFLRSPDGHFTTIDAPGATLTNSLGEGIYAMSINDQGEVAGQFLDSNLIYHGFIRYPDGRLSFFDVKGAGTGQNQGTVGEGINSEGDVSGYYIDANGAGHGFVRSCDGVITTFDAPGAGTGAGQGTFAGEKSINAAGEISGSYTDANNVNHGLVRSRDGNIVTYDAPGSGTGQSFGTQAAGINPEGDVTGYWGNATNELFGFVRYRDGSITSFSVPGAGAGSIQGTAGFSINSAKWITGIYIDPSSVLHGFLRAPDGASLKLNAPGAGTGAGEGTRPEFVSPCGVVVGFFYDENGVVHGFAWIP